MDRNGLLIGVVASRSGVSRKALRLYERAGILPPASRTAAGYRVYGNETLPLLAFVGQARRLGFRLNEIKAVVEIKRSGRAPCPHVFDLVHQKVEELGQALADLGDVRRGLQGVLKAWRSTRRGAAAVCPHIEHLKLVKGKG